MQYTMMVYLSADDFTARDDPAQKDAYWGAWFPYMKALKDAGVWAGGAGLEPPETATTLRFKDGQRMVQDGPYADSKEQLGGFLIFDVPDLDTALEWAGRCPDRPGWVLEVRPNLQPVR